ncbi:MAG: sulfurtransferase TusA family protein [Clostridia bacterium]|nr:sulfurtransferase TusA family protein [Clostridia bacterium]
MAEFNITDTVDITDVVCPVTFVKAKVALEELDDGDILSIRMNDGEPVQNVPRSIKEEGHQILKLIHNADGTYNLIVRKVEE